MFLASMVYMWVTVVLCCMWFIAHSGVLPLHWLHYVYVIRSRNFLLFASIVGYIRYFVVPCCPSFSFPCCLSSFCVLSPPLLLVVSSGFLLWCSSRFPHKKRCLCCLCFIAYRDVVQLNGLHYGCLQRLKVFYPVTIFSRTRLCHFLCIEKLTTGIPYQRMNVVCFSSAELFVFILKYLFLFSNYFCRQKRM